MKGYFKAKMGEIRANEKENRTSFSSSKMQSALPCWVTSLPPTFLHKNNYNGLQFLLRICIFNRRLAQD